jgi:hypothetical protein
VIDPTIANRDSLDREHIHFTVQKTQRKAKIVVRLMKVT